MKLLPKLVKKIRFLRAKILVILLLLISLPLILSFFAPRPSSHTKEKTIYYASELTIRSTKTTFTIKEKPTFSIGVGKIGTPRTSMLERFLASFGLTSQVFADDEQLPDMEVRFTGEWPTPTNLPIDIKKADSDEVSVSIADVSSFKPGKYRMSITSGERNIEQDFTWGVLALNTDKSVYRTGETAKVGMAILDDYGRTKCLTGDTDFLIGKVWLTITSPSGKKTDYSTEQGNVLGSPGCGEHSITNEPDFYISYKTKEQGTYHMHFIGENQNGKRTLDDYFEVKDATPYSVTRRDTSMRIYPYSLYTNSIDIKVDQDFTGQVIEQTPASFIITCETCSTVEGENTLDETKYETTDREATHKLIWNVSWKKGETHTLTYTYDAPKVSPEFYLLGPIKLTGKDSTTPLFEEIRSWQIASDVVRTWDGGSVANNNWNTAQNWSGDTLCGSTDVCTFDNTSDDNADINVSITPDGIDVNSGYDGTITQQTTNTITTDTTSGVAFGSGTFTGGSGAITLTDGSFVVDGGTVTTTTGAVSIQRNFTFSSGSFTNSASGMNFTDNTNADDSTLSCSATLSGTWRINKTTGGDFSLGSGCTVSMSENVTSSVGLLTNDGTLTITGASTVLNIVDNNVDNNSSLTVDSGGTTLTVERNFDNTGGTLTNNGTITFPDSTNADDTTLTCGNSPGGTFQLDKDIGGDFTLSSGCTITATENVTTSFLGAFTIDGTLTLSNGTFDTDLNTINNNGSLTINSDATVSVDRNFDNDGATLVNNGTIVFEDDVDAGDDTTFTCDDTVNGTVRFDKDQLNDITIVDGSGGDCIITNITVGNTGATNDHGAITSAGTLTFTDTSNTLNVDGSFTNTGSVTFNSSTNVQIDNDFNNTNATLSNSGTIAFEDDVDASDDSTFTCDDTVNGTVRIDKDQINNMVINDGGSGDCVITNLTAGDTGATNNTALFTSQGTVTFAGATTLRITSGDFTNSGSFTNNGTINLERSFTDSGTVTAGSGTYNFTDGVDASDDNTWTCGASSNLGTVVVNKTNGNHVVLGSDCRVGSFTRTAGVINNPAAAYTLKVDGNMSLSSTTNMGGANMTFSMEGSGTQTINFAATSTTFVSKFQVNKSGGSASLTTNALTVTGQTCTVVEGTFDLNALNFTCSTGFTVEDGGNLQLVSTETLTSPTLNSGSTVTYKGDGDGVTDTFTMKAYVYHHLTINSATGNADTYQPPNAFTGANDINGNLTITLGTFDVISGTNYGVDVVGNFSNAGTFLAQAGTLKVGTNFTNTGTFTAGTGTVEFNTSSTTVVNGTDVPPVITFNNLTIATNDKIVNFTAGKTFRVNGVLTITGTSTHEVVINSTTGSQWFINHQGTENVTYANITNSGCDGSSTTITLDATSINNGNNGTCWSFPVLNITVSGNIYSDEGSNAYDCSANNITVYTSVNGAANDTPGTCTLNTGAFSITATKPTAADQPVVIFIDSGESIKATTVTLTANATSNITGVKLYVDHLVLSHENAGPMTNAKLATGDNGDAGIRYSVVSSNLTVESGIELFVYDSKTYTPGGSVTTQGTGGDFQLGNSATATLGTATNAIAQDIVINTSASLTINADTTVAGGDISATGTLTTSSGTPTITVRGTGSISGSGTKTVYNLIVGDGTIATTTLSGALTANNDVTVGTGSTLHQNASLTVSGGDFTTTTTGVVDTTSGTGTVTISGTGNVGAGSGGTFGVYNLTVSGTQTLVSDITTSNDIAVTTGASLELAGFNVGISGGDMTTAGTGTITCASCSSGTVTISGTGTIGGGGAVTIYNLSISGTQTLASTTTASNDIAVATSGTLDIGSQNLTVNGGDFTTTGAGVISCSSCSAGTVTISGTGTLGSGNGNITFYNVTTTGSGTTTFSGAGTNTVNNNVSVGTGTTLNINSSVSITGNLTTTTTGVINTTSGTPTVTVSGTVIGGGSGNITIYNLTKATSSTAIFSGGGTNTISNNLTVSAGTLTVSNNVSIGNDVSVATSSTLNLNGDTSVSGGDATTAGTGVISTTNGTPTLTISGTGTVGGGGAVTTYNLTISGTQTISSATNVANALTVNGTMSGSSTVTVNGAIAGTGTVSHTGTVEQRVGADANFGTTSGTNAWSFSTLIFSNSTAGSKTVTTQTGGSGGITVSTLLQVGKGTDATTTVFDAGNRTWTLSGTSGTPFTIPKGSVTANTSTFTYTGNNSGGNTLIADTTYYSLVVNNSSETWNLSNSLLTINNGLTVTAGTLDLQTNSMSVGTSSVANSGGISVAGTITQSAGGTTTVKTSAAGAATVGGAGTLTFYSLTIAPTAASGTITLGSAASQTITVNNNLTIGDGSNAVSVTASTNNPAIDVNGNLAINASGTLIAPPSASFTIAGNFTNNGTFTHNSGTVTLDTTTTATLAGSGSPAITFNSLTIATSDKTVLFTSGETFRTNGVLTVTGTSGHPVTIDATTDTTQWYINHQGTESLAYAAVQDSGCDGTSTNITLNTTSTNNGNNGTCWVFTMDVSGNIYTDEGSTAYNCSVDNLTVHLSVNGGANENATCNQSSGAFTFTNIPLPSSGTPFVVFIDSVETPKATTVSLIGTGSISNLKLYQNYVIVSHENSGPITNANLATADNADAGIRYAVSGGNLTTDSGMTLFVYDGKTYTPGGSVTTNTTGGNFKLAASSTATLGTATNAIGADITVGASATLTINADTTVSGGDITTTGTLTTSSGTPTVTVRGTGTIGSSGSSTFYNLAIGDGTTATSTLGSTITVNNDISVGNGSSLALNNKDVTIAGGDMSTTGTGSITCTSCSAGTVTISGTGNIGGGGTVTVYNLTSSSGTQTLASATTALNNVTVDGTVTGSQNLTLNGAFAGTGTVTLTGTTEQRVAANQNFGTTSGTNAWSFATLIFSNSSGTSKTVTTQTGGSGGITASTLLQIGKSGDSASTVLDAGNRTWTLSGTSGTPFTIPQGSLTPSTSTFSYTGNNGGGNTTLANTAYYSLSVNNSSETYNAAASPLTVNNALTVSAGTLDLQTNSLSVGSTSVTNSGSIANSGTLTQSSSGTTTVKTSASGTASIGGSGTTTFYNLTIAPTAASGIITLGNSSSQTITVSNDFAIGDGSNAVTVTANTYSPTLDVNGSFTINGSGTFVAPASSSFTIAKNMTNNGTFTANGGTITFDTTNTSTLAGSGSPAITFYNISSSTSTKSLLFTAGETFRTDGLVSFTNVNIDSTTSSQWFINHQGSESIGSGTTITNSGCDASSTTVNAVNATNGGNNGTCWLFAGGVIPAAIKGNTRIGGNTRFQ